MDDVLPLVVKGGLFTGLVVLVGVGLVRRVLLPTPLENDLERRLRAAAAASVVLLLALGPLDLWVVLRNVLGTVSREVFVEYATSTTHGRLTLARSALVLVLGLLATVPNRAGVGSSDARASIGRAITVAWALATVAVVYTFSAVSHAAAVPVWSAVPADMAHLAAASVWVGAVGGIAFLPLWAAERHHLLVHAVGRVSTIGMLAVLALFATGLYATVLHVGEPAAIVTTPYGVALAIKVILISVIVGLAGVNRFHLLPALRRGSSGGLRTAMRLESVLLAVVLAATAFVTTSAPPH